MYVKISKECESCNLLRELLEEVRTDNRRLMDKLLALTNPVVKEEQETVDSRTKPIQPATWRVRRTMLEDEDRKRAELERKKKEELAKSAIKVATIDELERELGVEDVEPASTGT